MKALTFSVFGTPDVLEYKDVPDPLPQPNCAIVRTKAIGLNFADVYRRQGRYHLRGSPPFIAGYEAAGIIESVAADSSFKVGDRVAFADVPFANAELVSVPLEHMIPLPTDISFEIAAALLLQGLTAQYLVQDSHKLQAGESVVIHAAAGGVGLLLVQLAKAKGAKVLGLTSSEEKASAALAVGADEMALYSSDWVAAAQRFSSGGADVIFDSVGSTLMQSFDATRVGGHVVFYGMAGGDPPHVDPRMLMDTSKTLTGGDLWNYLTSAKERISRASALFALVQARKLEVHIAAKFALSEGAAAHRLLEGRGSSGKVLLMP